MMETVDDASTHDPVMLTTQRQPSLEGTALLVRHCHLIHQMVVGKAAAELLGTPDLIPDQGLVAVGATWWWTKPGVSMGKKNTAENPNPAPVRIEWQGSPVAVVASPSEERFCTARGLGRTAASTGVIADGTWLSDTSELFDRDGIITHLGELASTGKDAGWWYRHEHTEFVRREVVKSHASLSMEASDLHGHPIFRVASEVQLEEAADRILFGTNTDQVCPMDSLLERTTSPDTFINVDPVRFSAVWLRREAKDQLIRIINDPRIGSRIRSLAIKHGTLDPRTVAALWRAEYPREKPIISDDESTSRVHRALRLGVIQQDLGYASVTDRQWGTARSLSGAAFHAGSGW